VSYGTSDLTPAPRPLPSAAPEVDGERGLPIDSSSFTPGPAVDDEFSTDGPSTAATEPVVEQEARGLPDTFRILR